METSGIIFTVLSCILLVEANPVYDSSISIPKECANKKICDVEPVNYPHDFFGNLVQLMQGQEFAKTPQYHGEHRETIRRDEENCSTRETIIQPFIVTSNTTARLVIQTKYFEQRVKQTECLGYKEPCFGSVINPGYEATCTPTDGTVKLYVYNAVTQRVEYESVDIPMCCSCSIKSKI